MKPMIEEKKTDLINKAFDSSRDPIVQYIILNKSSLVDKDIIRVINDEEIKLIIIPISSIRLILKIPSYTVR